MGTSVKSETSVVILYDDLDTLRGVFALAALPGTHVHIEALSTLGLRVVNDRNVDRSGLLAGGELLDARAEVDVVLVRDRRSVGRPPDEGRAPVETSAATDRNRRARRRFGNDDDGLLGLENLRRRGLPGYLSALHLGRRRGARVRCSRWLRARVLRDG